MSNVVELFKTNRNFEEVFETLVTNEIDSLKKLNPELTDVSLLPGLYEACRAIALACIRQAAPDVYKRLCKGYGSEKALIIKMLVDVKRS